MNWHRFYTPKLVAEKMIASLPSNFKANQIVDICIGSGNLVRASLSKNKTASVIGLDVDKSVVRELKNSFDRSKIQCINAVNYKKLNAFFSKINLSKFSCDLVVANPPFGFYHTDMSIYKNYIPIKLKDLFDEAVKIKRIEAFMLISNLMFLKNGGYFVSILPESFFSGKKWHKFKSLFLSLFENITISSKETFFIGSDVKTRIFIGEKNNTVAPNIIKVKKEIQLKHPDKIQVLRGCFVKKKKTKNIKNLVPLFHNTDINNTKPPKRYISINHQKYNDQALLLKNDIVINRVGKNCGTSRIITKDHFMWHASDCVFIIRQKLHSSSIICAMLNRRLKYYKRGLTVQYITRENIIRLLNTIP